MAAPYFIAEGQFTGGIQLDFGSYNKFDDYATQIEKRVMIDLLGWQVYYALISDLDGSNDPVTTKYIQLIDGITAGYSDEDGITRELAGIETMLPYFFYCYYVKDVQSHNTEVGDIEMLTTNSTKSIHARNTRLVYSWEVGRTYYNQLVEFINYKNNTEGDTYYENFEFKELDSLNVFGI